MDDVTCQVAEDGRPCGRAVKADGMCASHHGRLIRTGVATRREAILLRLPTGAVGECWLWEGRANKDNYGIMRARGASSSLAHRLAYEILVGPIPDGMTLDHMCHRAERCPGGKTCPHRLCCNPAHLKIAAVGPNALRGNSLSGTNSRKTHCDSGHEFTEANTYWHKGKRQCRKCRDARDRARGNGWARQREALRKAGDPARPKAA